MRTDLHRTELLEGKEPNGQQAAELDFLEREGLVLDDDEFLRRRRLGLPVFPEQGA